MISPETLQAMNREAAQVAAAEDRQPYVYWDEAEVSEFYDSPNGPAFPFTMFGDYRPDGWVLIDTLFADSSGFGRDDEPALSAPQLRDRIKYLVRTTNEVLGFALVESGQFQVKVGVFHRS